jgi:hypothetical protein
MSKMWITCFVLSMRVRAAFGPGRTGSRLRISANAGGALCSAAARKASPSRRYKVPNLASQRRVALSSMAWNTGSSWPGELETTCNTSDVAVCCSSASARDFCASASSRVRWSSCFWRLTADEM